MKITQLSSTVHQVTFLKFSNAWLLRETDGFTLIDCTVSGHGKDLVEAARQSGGEIRRILLTHAHGDHMGSLDELHGLLGNVAVAISEREAPLLRKDLTLLPDEPQQKPGGSFPGAQTQPTHLLTEGELFGSLRCIRTPGHTPGHMSFLDERDNTLFAGDALIGMGGTLHLVTATPWWFPLPKMATWDKPLANSSAAKLLPYKPKLTCTGHGAAIQDGAGELRGALQRAGVS